METGLKILVIATSPETRGGITSVIKSHRQGDQWEKFQCRWIATHIDKGFLTKLYYSVRAFILFIFLIPFYELVHIHFSEPPSAMRKFPFLKIAKLFGKKTILHFHAFSPETSLQGKRKKLYIKMFGMADRIIALSKYWKKEIAELTGHADKISVLYNPCPKVNRQDVQKKKRILFAGTINKRKGYHILIEAFAKIAEQYPEWKIQFAGNGEITEAQNLAKKLGILHQVQFLDWVRGDEKDFIFNSAEIFCLPSFAEGFPMAVLDAWAYGLPVICTPVGGLPEIVEDGKNAIVFPSGDSEILGNKLSQLISDDDLRKAIAKQSSILSETRFKQETINHELTDIYSKLVNP